MDRLQYLMEQSLFRIAFRVRSHFQTISLSLLDRAAHSLLRLLRHDCYPHHSAGAALRPASARTWAAGCADSRIVSQVVCSRLTQEGGRSR